MLINCIAIDDEPLALAKLEDFISKVPELRLQRRFDFGLNISDYLLKPFSFPRFARAVTKV